MATLICLLVLAVVLAVVLDVVWKRRRPEGPAPATTLSTVGGA